MSFLEGCKTERIAKLTETALKVRFLKLNDILKKAEPLNRISAPLEYVGARPEVRALLDVPHDVPVCAIDFELIRQSLARLNTLWIAETEDSLRNAVKNAVHVCWAGIKDPLLLAIGTLWRCSACKLNIPYPEALAHRCCWLPDHDDDAIEGKDQYMRLLRKQQCCEILRQNWRQLETTAHLVKEMLDVYGLSPFVTPDYLDAVVRDRLKCHPEMSCHEPGVRRIMNWRTAVRVSVVLRVTTMSHRTYIVTIA